MRILIAHSFYRVPGGEDHYVAQQQRVLGAEHEVELLSYDNADLSGGPATLLRMTTGRSVRDEVEERLDRFRPDVVHIHNVYPSLGPAVHLAARRRGIPIAFTVHNLRLRCPNGYMFTQGEVCRRCEGGNYTNAVQHDCFSTRTQAAGYATALWAHRFVTRLEDMVDRFIAPSAYMVARLDRWGLPPGKVRLIPNFTAIPPQVTTPGDIGLFLGRLSDEKGLDTLLDALRLAGDPSFVIAGDGPAHADLVARSEALGLERTTLAGRVDRSEVDELLARARVVVLPSRCEENAPLAALEAMASGRPLIVSALGGLVELAADGRGLAVSPADPGALGDAISGLMADEERCRQMGARARVHAQERFSEGSHLRALTRCYEEMLAARSAKLS